MPSLARESSRSRTSEVVIEQGRFKLVREYYEVFNFEPTTSPTRLSVGTFFIYHR